MAKNVKKQTTIASKTPKIKTEIIIPKMPKREKTTDRTSSSGKTAASDKARKPVEDIYQLLAETQKTIEELTRIYGELPDSERYGVGGTMRPTLKQQVISEQLFQAETRAKRIEKLIEDAL